MVGFRHECPLAEGDGADEHGEFCVVVFDADDGVGGVGLGSGGEMLREPVRDWHEDGGVDVGIDAAVDGHEHVAEEVGA